MHKVTASGTQALADGTLRLRKKTKRGKSQRAVPSIGSGQAPELEPEPDGGEAGTGGGRR